MKTTIDRAGRVVIPKAIRDRAGLHPGAQLDIRLDNGRVEISPQPPQGRVIEDGGFLFWESAPGTPPITGEMIDQAIQDVRREREDEIIRGALGIEDSSGF
jgi:AbrB family looped-hinge helix DNA binding protein